MLLVFFLTEWAARIGKKSLFTSRAHLSTISGVNDGVATKRAKFSVYIEWRESVPWGMGV
jgi:hypothetical protein